MQTNKQKAVVGIFISDKIDFETKAVIDKEGHYIMIKKSIQQDAITLKNIYAPKVEELNYIKQILMNIMGEISSNVIAIVGNFNIPLTTIDFPDIKSIRKQKL